MGRPPDGAALYGALAGWYDRLYQSKPYGAEAAELHRLIRRHGRPDSVSLLDVACGTGRHLAELRRWYPDVAGVDRSPSMLRVARRRLGPKVPLRRGEMGSFELDRQFDVVICLFSAFGYLLTERDRRGAVQRMVRHLRPGGILLIEGWIRPERWRPGTAHVLRYSGAEGELVRVTFTQTRGRRSSMEMHYLLARTGRPVQSFRETHTNDLTPSAEIVRTLRAVGLTAWVRTRGRWRDRGLYVGVRPSGEHPRLRTATGGPAGRRRSSTS